MNKTIEYYSEHTNSFKAQYLSKSAEQIHDCWLKHLPLNGQALDIGAGVGRDALWLAKSGFDVIAVEPSKGLREEGQILTKKSSVHWVNDTLPELSRVEALNLRFDLILLSAVWMHLPSFQRQRAFRELVNLLKSNGTLVISLRHGLSPDERDMYPVNEKEISNLSSSFHLRVKAIYKDNDKQNRQDVTWTTMVLINEK
jgi:2-polyprenyl-3-methyl-5-hydroxy-6-metoxy-1,4-benzoquinol methylase